MPVHVDPFVSDYGKICVAHKKIIQHLNPAEKKSTEQFARK